ncbi:Metallo-dependent phosphatase, partial [Anaeromyces robustus]
RLVAVGDIHGDYEHLISILRHAKLIDKKNNWIGKDTILVQVGDINERGNDTLKIYNTLIDIKQQAKEKGGKVHVLIGNHDLYAIEGNHFYTSLKDIQSYGGVEAFEEALGPEGKIGKFIREEMDVTLVIGDTLFAHGGLNPEYVPDGIDKLNEHAREVLLSTPSIEELYQLILKNITHPIYTDPIFTDKKRGGPIWSRYFANGVESKICPDLEETLRLTNTKRMIVGHTVQPYGKIRTKCNNKLILIDIGISRCIGG